MITAVSATYAATATVVVDVLFVTSQRNIPARLTEFLDEKFLIWARTDPDAFAELIDELKIIGTVVLDTSEIAPSARHSVLATVKKLEQHNIATILLNDTIDFPYEDCNLTALLDSAWPAEIEGRIEANLAYRNSLAQRSEQSCETSQLQSVSDDMIGELKSAWLAEIEGRVEANLAAYRNSLAQRSEQPPETSQPQSVSDDIIEQLKMAGQVQRNFLPKRLPNSDAQRFAVMFRPADFVSGDIYDVTRLDEQHIGFYLADAVGHSMPAALLTMFLKQTIVMRQTNAESYRLFTPQEVITAANDKMAAQDLAGCLFATCCYCLLNTNTLQLTMARAGHPYPILIRPGCQPQQLTCRGGLLGAFANSDFEEKTIQLAPGDKLFIYSDGCESLVGNCNDNSEFVFTEQFLSIAQLDADEMIAHLDKLVEDRNPPKAEIDDNTAIVLQIL